LDSFDRIGREMSGEEISKKLGPSSLNLTSSDISLAQQQGHAAVDLYRIWWEKYDKMTRGDDGGEGWGRTKEEDGDKMSSTFVFCLIALVFSLSFLMVLVAVVQEVEKTTRCKTFVLQALSAPSL